MENTTDRSITLVVASDLQLSTTLLSLENNFEQAARRNVLSFVGEENDYTDTEIHSMITIEQLKLINGMDLAAVLLRGKLIHAIESNGMWATHPGQYSSLQEMAQDQGISMSELSNVRTLYEVIFPYMENTLGMNIAETWERIGKSNFRDLAAVLRCLITGENNGRSSVSQSAEHILDEVYATLRSANPEMELDDDHARELAIRSLLENSERITNRELRQRIRPVRTSSIPVIFLMHENRKIWLSEITQEQEEILQNRLNGIIHPHVIEMSSDPLIRASQVSQVNEIMEFINQINPNQ